MNRNTWGVVLLAVVLVFASCAAGSNPEVGIATAQGVVAGFWRGLWHGVIAPVTFLISLFSDHVRVYEVHNNGAWYDLGFLMGVTTLHGGGHAARSRSRRRR